MALDDSDVAAFVRDGAIPLRGAFPREIADECRAILWRESGCDEHDPTTWTKPVVRIEGRGDAPFRDAANTPALHEAFDRLAGAGRWVPRDGIGTFPIRFPHPDDPGDAGWHIEATGTRADGQQVVDPASRERVLLLLFLFGDVGPDDAPTRVRLGSHLTAAREVFADGGTPVGFFDVARRLVSTTAGLPEVAACGEAGDVWLCHPFVVHAAQRHRGSWVKFMGQPPLAGTGPIDPNRHDRSPVEQAVALALSG